jgi:hypothetical protein
MTGEAERTEMSDFSQGPGWWLASDQRWYPPEQYREYAADSSLSSDEYPEIIRLDAEPSPLVAGERKPISRGLKIGSISAALAVAVVVILVVVLPGAASASGFLGGSGTATLNIDPGSNGSLFNGAFGQESFSGRVAGNSDDPGIGSPLADITGSLDGTNFALEASLVGLPLTPGPGGTVTSIPSILGFNVTGTFRSMPVRATLTWDLASASPNSDQIHMTLHGTVGPHALEATGVVSGGSGNDLVGTFQYTVS